MNFIKHISHSLFFASVAGSRRRRWIAVCALLAAVAAGLAQFNLRPVQAAQGSALQGEAALAHLKEQGLFGSLAAAMQSVANGENFQEFQRLIASDNQTFDQFGRSIAISGNIVVVGASRQFSNREAAYVFVRSGMTYQFAQKLAPSDTSGNEFGSAVAISGATIVVGARGQSDRPGAVYVFVRSGAVWTQQQKLRASDAQAGDQFGFSVAIEGDTIVTGAPKADMPNAVDGGAGYVFVRSGTTWSQQAKLTINVAAGDQFGSAVALSGNMVAVGAPLDDYKTNQDQGAVSIFERVGTAWMLRQYLFATDGMPGDQYGSSVALSSDKLIIGAPKDDGFATDGGIAYAYERSGGIWNLRQTMNNGNPQANGNFGAAVALSGNQAIIAEPNRQVGANPRQGAAYVFAYDQASWQKRQQLMASDGAAGAAFGLAVAIDGGTIAVGAPGYSDLRGATYIFDQLHKLSANDGAGNDYFGVSVAVSGDTVVIGAYGDDARRGAVYVFVRSTTSYSFQQKLVADDGVADDNFGYSSAISGNTIVVGAYGNNNTRGAAYAFVRSGTTWSQQQKLVAGDGVLGDYFGVSVAIDGDKVVVGADNDNIGNNERQGSAYVFARSGASWSEQQKLTANDGDSFDNFGESVAINGDTVAVGASGDELGGSAYVFARSGATWNQQQKLLANDRATDDQFGRSIAISGDTVVVGAYQDAIGASFLQGSAYVFRRSGTNWVFEQKLTASDGESGDKFGCSVAISGDLVLVGALHDQIGSNISQGSAYVFGRSGASWLQRTKLTASSGLANEYFGDSVAISGDTIVAGAYGVSGQRGAAYVLAPLTNNPPPTNNPPTISAPTISRPAGSSPLALQIATVGDVEDPEDQLQVRVNGSASATVSGVTISNINVSQTGVVQATVSTACNATGVSFTLTVTDRQGASAQRVLIVAVSPNPQPVLSYNSTHTVAQGGSLTINPASGLSDNGQITSVVVLSVTPAFSGAISVNPAGVVSVTGAAPAGSFSVVILAADNCGLITIRSFKLNVTANTLRVKTVDCNYSISPINHIFTYAGGQATVNVLANNGCAWTGSSEAAWITLSSDGNTSGDGSLAFTVAENTDATPRTGTLIVAGQKVTIAQSAPIVTVSAASFAGDTAAPESIVAAFGNQLAKTTEAATEQTPPTTLGGTKVSVRDGAGRERFAPLFFVSPNQINFQIPSGTATGRALVTIINDDETVAAGAVQIEMTAPSLFSADLSGQGLVMGMALRLRADGSQSYEPIARYDEEQKRFVAAPIDPGVESDRVYLILFATGVRHRESLSRVSVRIGGEAAEAHYAGPGGKLIGMDQINALLPRSLAGRGEVEVVLSVDGVAANLLKIAVR